MDAFAHGLKIAAKIRADGVLTDFVKKRYASWDAGIGSQVEAGKVSFEDLERTMLEKGDAAANVSGAVASSMTTGAIRSACRSAISRT